MILYGQSHSLALSLSPAPVEIQKVIIFLLVATNRAIKQFGCGGASGQGALGSTSIVTKPSLSQALITSPGVMG